MPRTGLLGRSGCQCACRTRFSPSSMSESTVRAHIEHIDAKVGASSRAAATLFAVEHDLLA